VEALSLSAETLLLSIDPGGGGLLGDKKRVLRSVRAAGGTPGSALDELKEEGLAQGGLGLLGGRVQLVDRAPPARRFRELQEAIKADALSNQRDVDVFLLLASSGVLARRLPRADRRAAASRLRRLAHAPADAPEAAAPSAVVAGLLVTGDAGDLLHNSGLIGSGLGPDYDTGGGTDFGTTGGAGY
jgi:hypothetical protein